MDSAGTVSEFSKWVPFFSESIWPIFFLFLIFVFKDQIGSAYIEILEAIKEGRPIKIGDWFSIGERTTISQLVANKQDMESGTFELTASDMSQNEDEVVKGSYEKLNRIQERIRLNPGIRIKVLEVKDNVNLFSTDMLKKYISTLGIRYVVFKTNDKFDGWIEASAFVAQLPLGELFKYNKLKIHIAGVLTDSIPKNENAISILKKMEEKNLDSLAVVENGKFLFMVSRGFILSKLMTKSLFKSNDKEK